MAARTVAVFLDQSAGSGAAWLRGIARFARHREDWTLLHMQTLQVSEQSHSALRKADGLIVSMGNDDASKLVASMPRRVPVINLIQMAPPLALSAVCPDNTAAGRSAAEHLLGLGLRRFGYLAFSGAGDDRYRSEGFRRAIESAGAQCSEREIHELWMAEQFDRAAAEIEKWVREIGTPCGFLVFNDVLGVTFIRALRQIGFRVPDDIAVVGIDDHEVFCEISNPPLSSVNLNHEVVAYEAAATLDRQMSGYRPRRPVQTLIPPIGVIERRSSQMLAVEEDVARVMRLMIRQTSQRLSVRQMADHIQISQRALEKKFQRCLGRSPAQEMARLRIERCKRLLVDSEMSISQIALDAGFANIGHFCNAFRQRTSMTPTQYRRQLRGSRPGAER